VYLLKDAKGVVLYVGKAARLPDRVASYFQASADLGPKKQRMLDEIEAIEHLECESEWEALLTENRLIKDIRPRFNTDLIDDKSFPYLVVTTREDYPRVVTTRNPGVVDSSLEGQVLYGASPRASMGIDRAARAHAWLQGRDYVGPEDIQAVAFDVLRHRIVLSFEAEADGVNTNSVIRRVLDGVGVP